jgi:hypothetical protein
MPVLVMPEQVPVQVGVPRGPRENAFTEISKGLGAFTELAGEIQKSHDDLAVSQAEADFVRQLSDQKDQIAQSEPDPIKRIDAYGKAQTQLQQGMAKSLSPAAAPRFQVRANAIATTDFINYKHQQIVDWNNERFANFLTQEDQLAKSEAETSDPVQADVFRASFKDALAALQKPLYGQEPAVKPAKAAEITLQHDKKVTMNYGDFLINQGNFARLDDEMKSGRFSNLDQNDKYRLERRAEIAFNRAQNVEIRANKVADDAFLAQNLDRAMKGDTALVDEFVAKNRQFIKPDDVIYLRKQIREMAGGENADGMFKLQDQYETERQAINGLTNKGLAAKYTGPGGLIDRAGLDAKSSATLKAKIVNDLERANQVQQSQTNFNATQAARSARDILAPLADPTKPGAEKNLKSFVKGMSDYRVATSGEINEMVNSSVGEAAATGKPVDQIAKEKYQQYQKLYQSPKPPAPTAQEKAFMDVLEKIRKGQ